MGRIYHSKRIEVFGYLVLLIIIVYTISHETYKWFHYKTSTTHGETFDVVYTWVNGSDEHFRKSVLKYRPVIGDNRYDDKNELKYSLRSLEKYAPWLGHVYIVTNGQIPSWLNLEYEKVSVISHDQLIDDPRILPTFSSPVIEQFLHRIRNLSKRFVYFNDDVFLGSQLYPEDLYSESNGITIFETNLSPNCATFCDWAMLGNGQCDRYCNVQECQFDGKDCMNLVEEKYLPDFTRVKIEKLNNVFRESVVNTNKILTLAYGLKRRYAASHALFSFDKDIIADMIEKFQYGFNLTRFERFRTPENIQFPFMYHNYLQSEIDYLSIAEIFDKFDTDNSTTWSRTEVRTLITQLYPLPLNSDMINDFEKIIISCNPSLNPKSNDKNMEDTRNISLIYETYFNWEYQPIAKSFVVQCTPLVKILLKNFGQKKKYKVRILKDGFNNNLVRITDNVTHFLNQIDQLRKNPKKLICMNDERSSIDNQILQDILQDFYLSLFPYPSKFELTHKYHERINYIQDYLQCSCQKQQVLLLVMAVILILLIFFKLYISCTKHSFEQKGISSHKYHEC